MGAPTHSMLVKRDGALEELQTKFTDVDFGELGVVWGVGGGVPGVHLVPAKLHHLKTILLTVGDVALVCACGEGGGGEGGGGKVGGKGEKEGRGREGEEGREKGSIPRNFSPGMFMSPTCHSHLSYLSLPCPHSSPLTFTHTYHSHHHHTLHLPPLSLITHHPTPFSSPSPHLPSLTPHLHPSHSSFITHTLLILIPLPPTSSSPPSTLLTSNTSPHTPLTQSS